MTYHYKSRSDAIWVELFKIALTGTAAEHRTPEAVVNDAMTIANMALPHVEGRIMTAEELKASAPPLFEPLKQNMAQKQKQDEDDSYFGVAR